MSHSFQNELKKEFQLERMILFSDAVFAIAITLLAIEIKVPEIEYDKLNDSLLAHKLAELIPRFIGFLVSFIVIAIYWVVHHRTFGFVINYNQRLLWLNLFFLLAVVIMPFSSGLYSSYLLTESSRLPILIYVLNIVFLGSMSLAIWEYVANPKHGLSQGITQQMRKYFRFRALVPPLIFILLLLVFFFVNPRIAFWLPALIPVVLILVRKLFFKERAKKA